MKKEILKQCFSLKRVPILTGLMLLLNVGSTLQANTPEIINTLSSPFAINSTLIQGPTSNGQPLYVWLECTIQEDTYNPDAYTLIYDIVFTDENGNELPPDYPVVINYGISHPNYSSNSSITVYESRQTIGYLLQSYSQASSSYYLLPGDYNN